MNTNLNNKQLEAIQSPLTPQMVIAGAGTGKTSVLTKRIVYLIKEKNINPYRILAITFTNKASLEIDKRIFEECGLNLRYVGTFHKICLEILRNNINYLNREKNFRILDDVDQRALIKRIIKNLGFDKQYPKEILKTRRYTDLISTLKNYYYQANEVDYDVYLKFCEDAQQEFHYKIFKKIYFQYEAFLLQENMIDFDDILLLTDQLLKIPEVLEIWQNNFDAVLVDEFQDTNEVQFSIIKKIAAKHQNIFVVGDPDQSIYGWRGAHPRITQDFLESFPNANLILLEQNYRSTQSILNIANKLISHNSDRFEKNLFSKNEDGTKIKVYNGYNENDEAAWVVEQINDLKKQGVALENILILYRANYLTKAIEEQLIKHDLPYKIFGGAKFYQRQEVQTIIAYLNLVISNDPLSIEKIFNVPRRKITDESFEKAYSYSIRNKTPLIDVLANPQQVEGLSKYAVSGMQELHMIISKLKTLNTSDINNLIDQVFQISGYEDSLDKKLDWFRFKNIEQLKESWMEMIKNNPNMTLTDILSEAALYNESDQDNYDQNKINMMTVHNAKGLEFEYVFVTNLNEGVFPSKHSLNYPEVEEERRIAYVAYTRAKKALYLSSCNSYDYQSQSNRTQSRFINEVIKNIEIEKIPRRVVSFLNQKTFNKPVQEKNYLLDKAFDYYIGQNVEHTKFGVGTIIATGSLGSLKTLKIVFKKESRTIEIAANHVSIKPLLS